jgi:hypothetical protein
MLALQIISYRTFDKPYLTSLGEFLVTQARCPHDVANDYCVLIHKGEMAPLLAHAKVYYSITRICCTYHACLLVLIS